MSSCFCSHLNVYGIYALKDCGAHRGQLLISVCYLLSFFILQKPISPFFTGSGFYSFSFTLSSKVIFVSFFSHLVSMLSLVEDVRKKGVHQVIAH